MKKIILICFISLVSLTNLFAAKPELLKINNIKNSLVIWTTDCNQVLHNPYQVKCYSYSRRSPLFNMYYLDSRVNKEYKKRLNFRDDRRIPRKYQNFISCYHKNHEKQDRGHLMPDASADFNLTILKTTYLTSNFVPEYYRTNRISIAEVEDKNRKLASNHDIIVITGVLGSQGRLKNKTKCAVIPNYVYKIVFVKIVNGWKFFKVYLFKNGTDTFTSTSKISGLIQIEKAARIKILNN